MTYSITKNGVPLDKSLYTIDEKTKTFSSNHTAIQAAKIKNHLSENDYRESMYRETSTLFNEIVKLINKIDELRIQIDTLKEYIFKN